MQTANTIQSRRAYVLDSIGQTTTSKIFLAIAASALVAICAHVSLPLFFTPVPLTLQDFAVLLVGLLLGPSTAFAAMILYLAEGAIGLPVFTPSGPGGLAQLLGPTAGFLFSYPLAAAAAGAALRALKPVTTRFVAAVGACAAASVIVFALGAGWLGSLLHLTAMQTIHLGVTPFLAGNSLKIAGAAGIYAGLQRWKRA